MNLENIKPNFKTSNVLTTENTFNKDILSTDNHLVENINNHLLTASSQSTPLTLEAEFSSESAKVANSEVTNLKSNFVQPQNFDSTVDLTNSTAAGGFNETPITVNFVDGKTEKRINVPVSNSVLKDNFTGEAALKNQNNSVTVPEASPQSNVNSFNTVKTSNVNNLETNISPMGDDASSLEDTSLSKFEENQVSALSQDKSEYLDSNVLPVQGTVTGGNEEGVLLNSDLQNNPSVRNIGFREYNNPTDAQQTWVIVHGWNDTPDGRFTDLAQEITTAHPGDRVLLLDWREAAYNTDKAYGIDYGVLGKGNFRAATWIEPVAEFAVEALNSYYGIDSLEASQSLNLIGHSLGSLVSTEIGKIYRDGLSKENETVVTGNNEGARTITALDPPSARNKDENPFAVDPVEDIYDIDGRIEGIQTPETYADASVFSRAYVGEQSIAGNKQLAVGADEAFEMTFGTQSELTDFGSEHDRVVRAFTNTINQEGVLGDLLGIRAYDSIETLSIDDLGELKILEGSDKGFKGIINVSEDNLVTSLAGILKTGNQDDIVIGSSGNQEMHGTELFDFSGDSPYNGDHNDIFFGESGNDMILGDNNDDILIGGIGRDILNGGAGIDTFIFKSGDGATTESDTNIIEDFEIGIDKIGLTDINYDQLIFEQLSNGTAIMSGSEIIAILQNTKVE